MTRKRLLLVAAAAVLVAGGLVWWLVPDRSEWVPTCTDLAPRLQSSLGGTWTVSDPDPDRDLTESTTICEMVFVTAGPQLTGEVYVYAAVPIDPQEARDDVERQPCEGVAEPVGVPAGYLTFRACSLVTSERAVASVLAVRDDRRTRVRTGINIRDDSAAASALAAEVARAVAGEVMTGEKR